jgi:hypothetical protein
MGGKGGGIVFLFTPSLTGTGRIEAKGDPGESALGPLPAAGAGGGGGGALVLLTAHERDQFTVTMDVAGGNGGLGFSVEIDGGAGDPGQVIQYTLV